jgi:hypothetical protein
MNEEANPKATFSFATLISFGFVYLTISGSLWHFAYWSTFDFNYFNFITATDIIKSAIFPFFTKNWLIMSFTLLFSIPVIHAVYLEQKFGNHALPKKDDFKGSLLLFMLLLL